jgi:16S rRNA processing protein RimM
VSSPDSIELGFVLRAHGIRGALRIRTESSNLASFRRLFVGGRAFEVRSVRPDKDDLLVELDGISDRDAAEALKGQPVTVLRSELPKPEENELYVADLVGCHVEDVEGRVLGVVAEIFFSGGHETLVVRDDKREFMLPFVEAMVVQVDLEGRRLVCDLPEGLVELNEPLQ